MSSVVAACADSSTLVNSCSTSVLSAEAKSLVPVPSTTPSKVNSPLLPCTQGHITSLMETQGLVAPPSRKRRLLHPNLPPQSSKALPLCDGCGSCLHVHPEVLSHLQELESENRSLRDLLTVQGKKIDYLIDLVQSHVVLGQLPPPPAVSAPVTMSTAHWSPSLGSQVEPPPQSQVRPSSSGYLPPQPLDQQSPIESLRNLPPVQFGRSKQNPASSKGNYNFVSPPLAPHSHAQQSPPSWTTVAKAKKQTKKTTKTSAIKEIRDWVINPTPPSSQPQNLESWTRLIAQSDHPVPVYLSMQSKPYAPVKDWLFNGCGIPRRAVKGLSWISGEILELLTIESLKSAVLQSLQKAGASIIARPLITDQQREFNRLMLVKSKSRDDVARHYYDRTAKSLRQENPSITWSKNPKTPPPPAAKLQSQFKEMSQPSVSPPVLEVDLAETATHDVQMLD